MDVTEIIKSIIPNLIGYCYIIAGSIIFTNYIAMDCFCMDIAEAWIKHRKSKNHSVTSEDFMEWVDELVCSLEYNFDDVYEEEFGHREDEEDD